ncbi:SIMPL domain-containing protein, partial [Leucobacter soli]
LPADRAIVNASVSIVEARREDAVRTATEEHARLVARAKELVAGGAAARYVADPIDTYSTSWRDERGERVVEYHASAGLSIEVTALETVGELMLDLAEAGADARVSWELSPERRRSVLRELRLEAVEAARAAAEDYAAAIAAADVEIVSVRDARGGSDGTAPVMRAMAMADGAAPEVTIREIEVRVQIEGTFAAV